MPKTIKKNAGKITLSAVLLGLLVFVFSIVINLSEKTVHKAMADDVSTSVTVLNTPPQWSVNAQEQTESSATTPTNSESVITWVATANDSSDEDYYLLICSSSGAPTANSSAAPTCNGGDGNQWAVSAVTTDETEASAATTTTESFAESNVWYAWICDGNATLPKCNLTSTQGSGNTASPFAVNHRPIFTAVADDSPANPGVLVTWTTTAYDTDTSGSSDTVRLFVCKAADFTGSDCGAGGTWATSTLYASDPSASTTISIPTPDTDYGAYGYVIDSHGHSATTTQGTDSVLTVNNVAPSVTAATVSLVDTDDVGNLTLLTESGTTSPFKVQFTVVDNNSCQTSVAGDEISSAIANVYRSGVTQSGCDVSGEYNANNCYPDASSLTDFSCTQDGASCTGTSDSDATWTCTFSLWHIADPTDGSDLTDSTWWSENWLASVQITDDDAAASSLTEATSGNELVSFLAFDVATTSIAYGALEPGQQNATLSVTTDLKATGNVGVDEQLYGDGMCTTWSGPDTCAVNPASTIPVGEQHYATSSLAYALGTALTASTSPAELEINVPKTTSTSTPEELNTYWGINVPASITLSGDYQGQNTLVAIKGEAEDW